ncbi:type VI secretion system Vgr family protein [Acinetobacter larvae]|nr:type VI secretion system Vgr family protein [Acinetobacter larvae]
MLNHIYTAIESLGLVASRRAIHLKFSNPALNQQVFLQRIDAQHAINQGLKAELICLSTNAMLALKQFLASQVAVDQVTDQGQLMRMTGIVTAVEQGASDGALTLYKVTVEDATALWHQRRNSRVFMNKSVLEIVNVLVKEWQQRSSLFAASLSLDLSALKKDYDIRPFTMQSNESDYTFLTRLLRQEGINWLVDEQQLMLDNTSAEIQAQKLRLIDDNSQFQALGRRSIHFHRSHATEQRDSMTQLSAQRRLQPTSVYVQRWQADALDYDEGAGSVQSSHQHSALYDNTRLNLESAWHFSPAWMQDLKGEDGATPSANAQVERINQNLMHSYEGQAKQFIARSSVRDAQVGYWFELHEHPEIDQHAAADQEFLIIGKEFYNQNNLPKDLAHQVQALVSQSGWSQRSTFAIDPEQRQGNVLQLQRRHIPIVPTYHPLQHRPSTHIQRARVVGPQGEEIYVDAWGRIKVRFLFTRAQDQQHDAGAGSNNNDSDSAWVDVLTPWAGEGFGARFLPRIGELVAVDFFDGNIDRPFVVGRIHEAQRQPTQFDQQGILPDTKKISGIRSQEIAGSGFGQLRFDDTTGQISVQLQSSHAATQLNLGQLSHPKKQASSDGRGDGFELRTDQYGAVRAAQGLMISTHPQQDAAGVHLDVTPAMQQLESSLNQAKVLSDLAKNQQTDPLQTLENLQAFIGNLQQTDADKAASFKQALLLLASPEGIALSSQQDIHLASDGQIQQHAAQSINLSTQQSFVAHANQKISLFAARDGARLYAGQGKIELQAQSDDMELIARQQIKLISTEEQVEIIAPKKIVLSAAGSQIEISEAGIF